MLDQIFANKEFCRTANNVKRQSIHMGSTILASRHASIIQIFLSGLTPMTIALLRDDKHGVSLA
ncbi:hypothetical protein A6U96_24570 [Agrobacterium tumefaciens]|nr:hypothetical protein A6U96_24570 [Agrobacterium tumefaciens]